MEDRTAYALNSLLEKHYALGRVLRFRHLQRGRQATCYEVLTAGQQEYLLHLFSPEFRPESLAFSLGCLEALGESGFPVPRVQPAATAGPHRLVVDGPQGSHLVLTEHTTGQCLSIEHWKVSDLSHLGLRLAWLHRELADLPPMAGRAEPLPTQIRNWAARSELRHPANQPRLNPAAVDALLQSLETLDGYPSGLAHGGISPESVLLDANRQISAIVDWGLCQPGHPAQDVIDAFVHWCVKPDGMVLRDQAQALLDAYGSLTPVPVESWREVVLVWCGRHLVDHYTGCRPLPRGFATILANPDSLTAAISLCQSK